MSNTFELTAVSRLDIGKGASRRLRRNENRIPAIVYGGSEPAQGISLEHKEVQKALQNDAFYSHILTLKIDNKAQKVVLKDLHRHPYKPVIMHMDFQRISGNQKIHMHVPIHFIGAESAPGVKNGGVLTHNMKDIEIHCLPDNLPEHIDVDLSKLEIGQSIHLQDIKAPKGVEFMASAHGENPVVASIHQPRVMEVEEEAVAEEEVMPEESAAATESATDTEQE